MWHSIFAYWHWGAGSGLLFTAYRLCRALFRRTNGGPKKWLPIVGWLGHLLVNETLLAVMTMRFLTEQAKREKEQEASDHLVIENKALRKTIREFEAGFHSEPLGDSSSGSLGEILTRSKPPTASPPATSNGKPGEIPAISNTTSETS